MRFQLTERWPAVTDSFEVTDESGRVVYRVTAKTLSLRDRLTVRDGGGEVVAVLEAGWAGGYRLTVAGRELARISSSVGRVEFLDGRGRFEVSGDVAGREYKIADRQRVLATVSRAFFSLTERYGLDVAEAGEALEAVAVAVALHRAGER